jgi:L-seryl-tRNA(Ser) seleniumtransferase
VDALALALRNGTPSVVGRIQGDRLLLDLRSVFPRQESDMLGAVRALADAAPAAEPAEVTQ